MANSIRNNKEFRALLTRKGGALGSELQEFTGRAFVYSTWSLRCMETETHELWTVKEGKQTRYMLVSKARVAANEARKAAAAARKAAREVPAEAPNVTRIRKARKSVPAEQIPADGIANAATLTA